MSYLRRTLFVLVCALAGLALTASAAAAETGAQFSLQPVTPDPARPETRSYFVFDAQPGATISSQVRVRNSGTAAGTVRLYAVDAATDQTSGIVMLAQNDPRREAGTWLSLAAQELTLAPGASQVVTFTVAVPATARTGQHVGGLVAEGVEPREVQAASSGANAASFQVKVLSRAAVAVQVNLPGPRVERLDIGAITPGGGSGYQTLALTLRNSGTMMLKPSGTLQVRDAQGREVQTIALTLDTILPQAEIAYPVFMETQALGAGAYEATVMLRYGDKQESRQTVPFTISKAQVEQVFTSRAAVAPPGAPDGSATRPGGGGSRLPLLAGGIGGVVLLLAVVGLLYRRSQRA